MTGNKSLCIRRFGKAGEVDELSLIQVLATKNATLKGFLFTKLERSWQHVSIIPLSQSR